MYSEQLSSGSTVAKFDYFISQKDSMLITNDIVIIINNKRYFINLIIEHVECDAQLKSYKSKVTVSDLKKCFKVSFNDPLNGKPISNASPSELINISLPSYHFLLYFKLSLEQELLTREIKEKDIIQLHKPITINAQTSSDMDYEWDGNQYGDTSTFYVTSYKVKYIF